MQGHLSGGMLSRIQAAESNRGLSPYQALAFEAMVRKRGIEPLTV